MSVASDKIKENIKNLSNNTYGETIKANSNAYVNGAVAGGAVGILTAAVFKWSYVKCGIIGMIAGGYIGFKITQETNKDLGLKNVRKSKNTTESSDSFPLFQEEDSI